MKLSELVYWYGCKCSSTMMSSSTAVINSRVASSGVTTALTTTGTSSVASNVSTGGAGRVQVGFRFGRRVLGTTMHERYGRM